MGELILEGITNGRGPEALELSASLPGYVGDEAFVFIDAILKARHLWLVRLARQGDGWRIVESLPIAFS